MKAQTISKKLSERFPRSANKRTQQRGYYRKTEGFSVRQGVSGVFVEYTTTALLNCDREIANLRKAQNLRAIANFLRSAGFSVSEQGDELFVFLELETNLEKSA